MEGWMDGGMDGCMEGWRDGGMDGGMWTHRAGSGRPPAEPPADTVWVPYPARCARCAGAWTKPRRGNR